VHAACERAHLTMRSGLAPEAGARPRGSAEWGLAQRSTRVAVETKFHSVGDGRTAGVELTPGYGRGNPTFVGFK
jgi:hypothetical protein